MIRILAFVISIAGLFGCATERFGNFESNAPSGLHEGIATDTIQQLEKVYPPAQTQFNFGQVVPKSDRFGMLLLESLRAKGYAVKEYSPKSTATGAGLRFQYVIDRPSNTPDLYRLKLKIDDVTLTHAYEAKNNTALSAGAWAKME
ncbi:conjugal transfer protein TrbH (plasmid) [Methylomonas sp. LL1]|jgi:Conjugal transfer protein TrbH.|uniref:Conjugal transfer protein TrbH n=1 Tax=Methylomonas defluvii TaxID=3045149 RepID=A0ABU4UJF3_9GAMM|nr:MULTISPECIES: hypothetical protein [unclassified Methylomonas]MDX8129608.1 hypothetical protein [Methylomonas sp. OY6]QPK61403.1 conjugal transfer protein TrbH [Methylomonas sp. LL1]